MLGVLCPHSAGTTPAVRVRSTLLRPGTEVGRDAVHPDDDRPEQLGGHGHRSAAEIRRRTRSEPVPGSSVKSPDASTRV
ncbi:MAG: hypothetical protein JWQ53_728 [Klenkia sp.]|nr:hypothetical protein [Klenkia sp.]